MPMFQQREDPNLIENNSGVMPSAFPGNRDMVRTQEDIPEPVYSTGNSGALRPSRIMPPDNARGIAPAELDSLVPKIGGLVEVMGPDALEREAQAIQTANELQQLPVIQGVAAYILKCFDEARDAKEQTVERRMLENLRQRRGEYEPEVLAQLEQQHSAVVFMHITSNKCRAAAAWLRDALGDMPWSCEPTPIADLEPDIENQVTGEFAPELLMQLMQMGYQPSKQETMEIMNAMKDAKSSAVQEQARRAAANMTRKMKDQMLEGGFEKAFDQFIDDLATFPAAIIKGPVVRAKTCLHYNQDPEDQTWNVTTKEEYHLEWERVSPFDIYPAPDATDIDDGYLIERHRLSRSDLQALRTVEGYSPEAIDGALAEYKDGNINDLTIDQSRRVVEGKSTMASDNPSGLIEALQFWGPVQGRLLVEWGLTEEELGEGFDPLMDYQVEAWLVGKHVIKLQLNPDPLNRKPYYKCSWEAVPGSFWGNSIPDLCRDVQRVCNAAARALVNNMGIASGPQVMVNVDALPNKSTLSEMYPWKIWLTSNSTTGTSPAAPISFFQPGSNAGELMQIYNRFAELADEHTGIPRYMTGNSPTGGAGRTASGMSMLMNNAGKSIKAVVGAVDSMMKPLIERLYFYNMLYSDDPDLKGDVHVVPRGALNLVQKDAQQQRLNEFLGIALQNPMVNQLVGPEGIVYMLRQIVDKLGLDPDKIIPSPELLRTRNYIAQKQQEMMMQQQMEAQQAAQAAQAPQGQPQQPQAPQNMTDQRRLMDGTPQNNTKGTM